MCGRFTLRTPAGQVAEAFGLEGLPRIDARYNIAPTQPVVGVRLGVSGQRRECVLLRWGLIPGWADDPKIGNRMINARAETVASKPAFRNAFKKRRCLIVADGFYEWKKLDQGKQPYYIRTKDDRPFGFAGLWESWHRDGSEIESCTIITTEPNALMESIHNRMPVLLQADDYDRWLDPEFQDQDLLQQLLCPFSADRMEAYPVSTQVNSPRNDVPDCILPA